MRHSIFAQRLVAVEFGDMDGSIVAFCGAHGFGQSDHLTVQHTGAQTGRDADDERHAADEDAEILTSAPAGIRQ